MTEIDTLYAVIRSGNPICMVGATERAFHTFMRARARGIRGVLILCSKDETGKPYQPRIFAEDAYEPVHRRGLFEMGSEVILSTPNAVQLVSVSADDKPSDLELIITHYTVLGQPKSYSDRRFIVGYGIGISGFEFVHVDDALHAACNPSMKSNESWYDAFEILCADNSMHLEKFRPFCVVSYKEMMISTVLVATIGTYPSVLVTHYSIPWGYLATTLAMLEFSRSIFYLWATALNTKLHRNAHLWIKATAILAATAHVGLGQIRFEAAGESEPYFWFLGLFTPCLVQSVIGFAITVVYTYRYDRQKLTLPQFLWALSMASAPFLWGVLLLICALARVIGTASEIAGSIFISIGFAVLEPLCVRLFDLIYSTLIEKHYLISSKDEAEPANTKCVLGNQKEALAIIMAFIHSWFESARLVCLLSKTIWEPIGSTYLYSMALTLVINIAVRLSYGRSLAVAIFPEAVQWFVFPSCWVMFHTDIKFTCGWIRFGLLVGLFAARATIFGFDVDSNTVFSSWWFTEKTFFCFCMAAVFEAVEDIAVKFFGNKQKWPIHPIHVWYWCSERLYNKLIQRDRRLQDPFNSLTVFVSHECSPDKWCVEEKLSPQYSSCNGVHLSWQLLSPLTVSTSKLIMLLFSLNIGQNALFGTGPVSLSVEQCILDLFRWIEPNRQ